MTGHDMRIVDLDEAEISAVAVVGIREAHRARAAALRGALKGVGRSGACEGAGILKVHLGGGSSNGIRCARKGKNEKIYEAGRRKLSCRTNKGRKYTQRQKTKGFAISLAGKPLV